MATLKVTNIKNESFAGDQLYLKSDGKIGIGTTSPQRHLVLYESASGQTQIQFQNSTTGTATTDGFSVGLDSSEKGFIWNYEGTDTYIGGEGGTSITIKNDGKIGIGTTNATFLLDIRKDATSVKTHIGASDGSLATMPNSSEYGLSISGGNVEFGLHKDANGAYQAILGTYQGTTDIPLVFRTASRAERLRIRKDGKLQIGTAGGNSTYLALAGNAAMDLWGDGSEYPTLRLGTEVYNSVGEDIRFGRSDHGAADIRYHSLKSLHGDSAANNYLEFFLHDFGSSPFTSQKSAFKINGLGNAIIPDGDLVIGTAGHGIDFSAQTGTAATGAATGAAPAEVLAHYEEGTFTPTWGGAAISSVTYSAQFGIYTRIGNRVFGVFRVTSTGHTGSGGQAQVNNFPFTSANNTAAYHHFAFGHMTGFSYTGSPYGYVISNQSYAKFVANNNGSNATIAYPSSGNIDIIASFMYEV